MWDPDGWEFSESFTQAEAKGRRHTKAPAYFFDIVHVHLDHGCGSSNTKECLVPWDSGSNSTASAQVALEFMNQVYKLHGLPDMIVSNRARIFSSKFWQSLFTLIGTQLNLSIANHPQSDGQMERSNQCREIYLRCFVHACRKQWFQWLALDELWYHTSYHSTLGHSPFKVLYGHEPEHLGIDTADMCPVHDLQAWLQGRSAMNELLMQQLNTANQRLKAQADKCCTDHSFALRDMIFLKLQPHAQNSVAARANHKLSLCYYGPYKVLARIGSMAYCLELPASSQVHPIFHISQLRCTILPYSKVSQILPSSADLFAFPVRVEEKRRRRKGNNMVEQGFMHWSGALADSPTWEDLEDLRMHFPRAPAWGQAVSRAGEC